jgi:amino acid transporter
MNNTSPAPRPGLVRALGPVMAVAIVVGTVIGSGIFKKPQVVAENVPFFGLAALAWVLGGLLAFLGSLSLAEVAVLYPRAGGNYVFLREAYGRLAGFLWGWVEFWIIKGASLAALATVFTESLHDILRTAAVEELLGLEPGSILGSYWARRLLTAAIILGLALVNVRGVRWGGWLQLVITLVKAGSLVGIAVLPFVAAAWWGPAGGGGDAALPRAENLSPVWPPAGQLNFAKLGTAVVGVLWAYHGWMNIAPVAEEVRQPQRNIPLALLGGTTIIIILYLAANLAYYLVIPQAEMAGLKDTTVATDFCRRLLGPAGSAVASAAVMCSVFGALNGNLLAGPRVLYALGEDGLAPRPLGEVSARFHTPARAIWVMAGWAALLVLGVAALARTRLPVLSAGDWKIDVNLPEGQSHFDTLTNFVMFGAVIFETIAVATIFVFRWRLPHAERPYRCWGYPVVPALYVVILALVLANMWMEQRTVSLAGLGFIAGGAGVYGLMAVSGRGAPK